MGPKEAFLSHSSKNRSIAAKLARVLVRHGVPVWYSRTAILGAKQWHDEIGKALRRCDWFLLLLSPDAVKSKWVKRELLFALNNDRYEERIIPILWRDCDSERLSWTLSSFQIVDLRRNFADGCRDLLRIWGKGYDPG
jgi:hypothetical protein